MDSSQHWWRMKKTTHFVDFNFRVDLNNKVIGRISIYPSEIFWFVLLPPPTGKRERSQGFKTKLEGKVGDPTKIRDVLLCLNALGEAGVRALYPSSGSSPGLALPIPSLGLWQGHLHLGVSLSSGHFDPQQNCKAEFWEWAILILSGCFW